MLLLVLIVIDRRFVYLISYVRNHHGGSYQRNDNRDRNSKIISKLT